MLLFDIDGTLIHSGGAGIHALILAFKERFGIDDDLHDIEIAGMTDSGIVLLVFLGSIIAVLMMHAPTL